MKRTRPDFWVSLDLNFYHGGRTRVEDEESDDLQRNSRIGATVVVPFARVNAVKLGLSTGVVTASGGEVKIFSSLHVSGEQLEQLTGICAMLRFPVPEPEDSDDSDSDD